MTRPHRLCLGLAVAIAVGWGARADQPDLAGYRTVETAVRAAANLNSPATSKPPAYLGVQVAPDGQGRLAVAAVLAESPAAAAGVRPGDLLLRLDDQAVSEEDAFHDLLRTKAPGDSTRLCLRREEQTLEFTTRLAPLSRPLPVPVRQRASLGVQVTAAKQGEGVTIEQVVPGSAADKARLKTGEVILKVDEEPVSGPDKLREVLAARQPGDSVALTLLLAEKAVEFKVRLGGEPPGGRRAAGWGPRSFYWTKPVYRVAVIGVEYLDVKHNPKIPPEAWQESMFSRGTYTRTSATGQTVYGSMADYYFEQSYGQFAVEGKAFPYVEVSKKRPEYATGNRSALLSEALDKLLARDGDEALKDFDGVFFIYAGDRFPAARGSLYWPHRATFSHRGKRWPYFICPEGGARMTSISVFCHEFGHLLGLPDLYARPENPGMEGAGVWCAMSQQAGNGRPQHFCAWAKEKLGWVKPAVLDPRVKQKLILAPVEGAAKECFKVLVRPDGSEYLLLENRRQTGFDRSLPAEGLLIWRVVGNRPTLQESHGVDGPAGPRVYLTSVPYPSAANDAYTPYTTPSSRAQLGGGLPVYLTNIRRLPDGRITFHIGYEYQ